MNDTARRFWLLQRRFMVGVIAFNIAFDVVCFFRGALRPGEVESHMALWCLGALIFVATAKAENES